MRTVTFSNKGVADFMNANFVSAWKNIQPKTKFTPAKTENARVQKAVRERPGTGATNIAAYVATADGRVLHVIQGYAGPELFLRELRFGIEAARKFEKEGDAGKLKSFYQARRKNLDRHTIFDWLLERNMKRLESNPLPSLDILSKNTLAGLRQIPVPKR